MDSESKQERRQRRQRRRLAAGELVQDFARSSTLHGLRYTAESGLSRTERIFWTVSFAASLGLCATLIWNVWVKWQSIPTIITLSEDLVSIREVPFPSVTICPHTKVKQSVCNDRDFVNNMYRKSDQPKPDLITLTNERLTIEAVHLILGWHLHPAYTNKGLIQYVDAKVIDKMFKVAPTLDDVFFSCQSYQEGVPCKTLFQSVLTMEGVCFTMNSLAASEILRDDKLQKDYSYVNSSAPSVGWSHSGGYSYLNSSADVYPRRGGGRTYNLPDIEIVLRQYRENKSMLHSSNNDGFKVYLHHPADLPQSSVFYYSAPPEQSVSFGLKVNVMNTSNSLRSYSPHTRRCFFPEERQLRYFHTYTDSNCGLECLANYTLELCGCAWFHIPHNDTRTICRAYHQRCFERAFKIFDEQEGDYSKHGRCRCYPLCLHIQYEADIVKSLKFDYDKLDISWHTDKSKFSLETYTRLELFYKASSFVSMRRSELFGLTDFLANCGGLLGLFLGFSFLSLVEIAYFLTLRLGCSLRRDMQQADVTNEKNEQLT